LQISLQLDFSVANEISNEIFSFASEDGTKKKLLLSKLLDLICDSC
jgi:hypothetical protein